MNPALFDVILSVLILFGLVIVASLIDGMNRF